MGGGCLNMDLVNRVISVLFAVHFLFTQTTWAAPQPQALAARSIFAVHLPPEMQQKLQAILDKLKSSKKRDQRRIIANSIFKAFFRPINIHSQAVLNILFQTMDNPAYGHAKDTLSYTIGNALIAGRTLKVNPEQLNSLLSILREREAWPQDDEFVLEELYLAKTVFLSFSNNSSLKVSSDQLRTIFSVLEALSFLDIRRLDFERAIDSALSNSTDFTMDAPTFTEYSTKIQRLNAFPKNQWLRLRAMSIAMANDESLVPTYKTLLLSVPNVGHRKRLLEVMPLATLAKVSISKSLAALIRSEFCLTFISFAEQGEGGAGAARNQASSFAHTLLANLKHVTLKSLPEPPPRIQNTYAYVQTTVDGVNDILPNHTFIRAYSRKLLFRSPEGKLVVLRFRSEWARNGDNLLDYESRMMDYLHKYKTALGLKGEYPQSMPLAGNRIVRIRHLPIKLKSALDKTGSPVDENYMVSAYTVDDLDYFTRLNDANLEPKAFREAALINIHDLFTLARHGLIHTVPVALFHNLNVDRREDHGRYLPMVDIFNPNEGVNVGLGRLHAWPEAVGKTNLGALGLTDYEEIWPLDALVDKDAPNSPAADLHIIDKNHRAYSKEIFFLANYIAEYVLSWTLVVASYLREREELYWKKPEGLAEFLVEGFDTGYRAFTGLRKDRDVPAHDVVNFQRLSKQIGFFLAKGYPYAPFMVRRTIPKEIFSLEASKIHFPEDGVENAKNWKKTPYGTGASVDRIHPDIGFWNSTFWLQELVSAWYMYAAFMMADIAGQKPQPDSHPSTAAMTGSTTIPEFSL